MSKATYSKAQERINAIRLELKKRRMTVAQLSKTTDISVDMVRYYVKQLIQLGHAREAGEVGALHAKVYEWALKPLPVFTPPPAPAPEPVKPEKPMCTQTVRPKDRAVLTHPPKPNPNTLTRWVGGNPFERLTA